MSFIIQLISNMPIKILTHSAVLQSMQESIFSFYIKHITTAH